MSIKLHEWQEESYKKVIYRTNKNEDHNIIPVNASVSSGKTTLAALALADFIDQHRAEKTIQMFVTPRIKLCAQQNNEISEQIAGLEKYAYQTFSLFAKSNASEYQIIPVDCTQRDWDRSNNNLDVKHTVFIVCDASLWGSDKKNPDARWNAWIGRFNEWAKAGYIFGNVIFDEAHNYKNNDKLEKMFGQTNFGKRIPLQYAEKSCMLKWFKNVMLLSGTPAAYQKDITNAYPNNECKCPLNMTIKNGWACRPILNLVHIIGPYLGDSVKNYSNAVIACMKHEQTIVQNPFDVRLLVNFGSIDEIKAFLDDPYVDKHIEEDFHLVTIHSTKDFTDDEDCGEVFEPRIDRDTVSAGTSYNLLEALDNGIVTNAELGQADSSKITSYLSKILDGKPIIVCQVKMIGEGINIKSFNSVITKSNEDTTTMQQIGRVLRNYRKAGVQKENPNIYCIYDNIESLQNLLGDLMFDHNLTDDCFSWGDKIDVCTGSSPKEDDDKDRPSRFHDPEWNKINEFIDADIQQVFYSKEFQEKDVSKKLQMFENTDDFDKLVKDLATKFNKDLKKVCNALKKSGKFNELVKVKANKKTTKQMKAMGTAATTAFNEEPKQATVQTEAAPTAVKMAEAKAVETANANTIERLIPKRENEATNTPTESNAVISSDDYAATYQVIIEIVQNIRKFLFKHKDDPKMMKIANENVSAIVDYLFSYSPDVCNALDATDMFKSETFRKLIAVV